jgi:REP element-mobilizing transposase RayT
VFRLADSLPARLLEEIAKKPKRDRLGAADAALDQGHGRRDLEVPKIAILVQQTLLHFDGDRYRLLAWCIMPNHVHALAQIRSGQRLDRIVHSWKSFTAHQANRLLGRTGLFWAPEYFDRYMRDEHHLAVTLAYIEENPVRAGLCREPAAWPYSSALWR